MVEAIENEFIPVLVHNNKPGKDKEILTKYGEPAWNFQVIRFLNGAGDDVIPRRDKVWSVEGVAARMVEALQQVDREVPKYLEALSGKVAVENEGTTAFAMHCFWTGELRFGGLEGVLTTEAGWLEGKEVTLVTFDRERLSFDRLLNAAVSYDCANKVFTNAPSDASIASSSRLSVGSLSDGYRAARQSDQKRQLGGTPYEKLNLSPIQATKLNAFARTDSEEAVKWLSPNQREALKSL